MSEETNKRSKSDVEVVVTIENAAEMDEAYVRTRHNNLRCFPKCAKVHKTKSFCGSPMKINIRTTSDEPAASDLCLDNMFVFGVTEGCPSRCAVF